jgi:hypothetical protein
MRGTPKLRASKAHVWCKEDGCTGYTRLLNTIRPESERDMSAVNEGKEAHKVLEDVLKSGGTLSNTGEMYDYARELSDIVFIDPEATVYIEVSVPVLGLSPRIDVASFNETTAELHIWEYKYGMNTVEVEANPQLLLGALGLITKYNMDVETIHCHVFQPRAFHRDGPYRHWDTTMEVFDTFTMLVNRMIAEHEQGGVCRTGSHCLSCPIMLKCDAHTKSTMSAIDFTEIPEEWDRDAESIGSEYAMVKRIYKLLEKRLEALKTEAVYLTEKGEHTGFYIKPVANPMKWNRSNEEMLEISRALGIDISKGVNILTPKQAIDGKLISESAILNFASRPAPRSVLTKLDNKEIARRFT